MLTEDLPSTDALDGLPYENFDGYELVSMIFCILTFEEMHVMKFR
jgi:hypothetical protein